MIGNLGERCHRTNLDTVATDAHTAQLVNTAQIYKHFGFLDAVLQPVEAVQSAGHYPGIFAIFSQQPLRIRGRTGLQQIECWHYISYDCHGSVSSSGWSSDVRRQILAIRGCCMGRPASNDARIVSAFTGARWKISSPTASEIAFSTAAHPPPTGGSPTPRAPTGVSGSGIFSAFHCISTGTSRMVGGLVW